jgi:hypothetical protein
MAITLPTNKVPAATQDPKNLILYGVPKIGKTTILSHLESCLIIDIESGSDYVDALKIKISTLAELRELCVEINKAGKPYKFIAIDTVTTLEEFAKPIALANYKKTPAGASFEGDILMAPMGAGYAYVREAVEKIINMVASVTTNVILVGHVKDKSIVNASGAEIGNMKDFDLTGKLGRILAAKSDAIGFIYRDEDSNLCINFETNGEATAGARPEHLANKRIIVSEKTEDGFISHWDRIFPSLITKKND